MALVWAQRLLLIKLPELNEEKCWRRPLTDSQQE